MITCTFENGKIADSTTLRHTTVDVIVCKDSKILLAHRAPHLTEGGKWSLIGGYIEPHESIMQAAKREVLEETGWRIKDLTLLRINDNPNRPNEDRQNIAFVIIAAATKLVGKPDDESDDLQWYSLAALPPGATIAFDHLQNIALYKKYLAQPFTLPIICYHEKHPTEVGYFSW